MVIKHKLFAIERDGRRSLVREDQLKEFVDDGWKQVDDSQKTKPKARSKVVDEPAADEAVTDEPADDEVDLKAGDIVSWLDGNGKEQEGEVVEVKGETAMVLKDGNRNPSKLAVADLTVVTE